MRSYGADTPQLYQSKMGVIDARNSMIFLQHNNKMYEAEQETGSSVRTIDEATGRSDKFFSVGCKLQKV